MTFFCANPIFTIPGSALPFPESPDFFMTNLTNIGIRFTYFKMRGRLHSAPTQADINKSLEISIS